ncbi:hypothetical protein NE237_000745 [Protea cynaroides]|uniref:Uncharacterized protein n=1 Tax=Protea cynaroides TaxID=273540 RepID=A0A9Q0KST7_9MAGN|nr:hypothetical protein NE237_000745 [Protea cynaroides]
MLTRSGPSHKLGRWIITSLTYDARLSSFGVESGSEISCSNGGRYIQSGKEEKPIKNRILCKLVMESVDLSKTLLSYMKKAYLKGRDLQEKERNILEIPIRPTGRNCLKKYVDTLKKNLRTYIQKFKSLKFKVDKKLKSAKLWEKILSIFFHVACVVISLTVYMILVISTMGLIMVSPLPEIIQKTVKIFLKSIGKWIKSLWKEKEEDLKAQLKLISSDNIHQLLEENIDQEFIRLYVILQKITILQKQTEGFMCYMESKKKHFQEHHRRTYTLKSILLKINQCMHWKMKI